jgi:hypothetical protein
LTAATASTSCKKLFSKMADGKKKRWFDGGGSCRRDSLLWGRGEEVDG